MDIKEWMPEFKVSAESDPDLIKYFLKTEYVNSLLNTSKWLLLGRKGTGKTAIYEYFKNTPKSELNSYEVITLNFKDYPWPIHKLYKETMEGEMTAYFKSWHYIIIVQSIARIIKLKEDSGIKLSEDLSKAHKYLNQIYGNPNPGIIEIIKSKIVRIDKLSLPSLAGPADLSISGGEVSFEEVSGSSALKEKLRTNAYTLLSYFERVLLKEITSEKILIVIDQLDENWLSGEITEYSKILTNLIQVCQYINNGSKFLDKIKIIILLRTDIYETLRFNDKTKVYQDSAIEVRWDANSLGEMFFERIKKYKKDEVVLDYSLKTDSLFDVKTVRHGATPFKHILRRSFYRPRDIIVFMNKIRQVHSAERSTLYTSSDLYDAERDYSQNIYGELLDEWSNQKPEIEKFLVILQNIGIQSFNYEEYKEKYEGQFENAERASINESLLFLFQNSIVGQKPNANWEYYCTNPYMQIDYTKDFHVNNGLKTRLNLTESRT
jgi:hypothetical protein